MKNDFSQAWRSSSRPGKQRKWRVFAPIHARHALISAHLSKDLRTKHGRRSFPLRKGDEIKVMIGKFKGKSGKISEINNYKLKVFVDGMQNTKKDGTKYSVPLDPSNLMITSLILEDKKRVQAIAKVAAKPAAKAGEKK
jgi:large subunit ribosomal protein L24